MKNLDKKIEEIATKYLHTETLESRHMDNLDFYDCNCQMIKEALLQAYKLGLKSK